MKNVKILKQSQIFFDDVLTEDNSEHLYQHLIYDNEGNMTSETTFNEDGDVLSKSKREYDEFGRLIMEMREENELETEIFKFRFEGKLLVEECHEFGELYTERAQYTYDEKQRCIERANLDDDDEVMDKKIMIYENDLLTKIENVEDDEAEVETEFFYDENGNKIEEIYHTMEGKEITTNYTYENNLLVKTITYNEYGGISQIEENIYDEKKRIIKTITKTHDETATYLFDFNDDDLVYHLRVFNRNDVLLQEVNRVYENGLLLSTESIVFKPELNRKEVTVMNYVSE